jgi:hypothetical protein
MDLFGLAALFIVGWFLISPKSLGRELAALVYEFKRELRRLDHMFTAEPGSEQ